MIERGQGGQASFANFGGDQQSRDLSNEIGKLRYSGELMQRIVDRLSETADGMEESTARQYFPSCMTKGERQSEADVARAVRSRMSFAAVGGQDMLRITGLEFHAGGSQPLGQRLC